MEIEVKYRIVDEQLFEKLKILSHAGKLQISSGEIHILHDTYFDTASRHLLAAGYALRERRDGDTIILSLKSLTPTVDHVHTREEVETQSTNIIIEQPCTWPDPALRDIVWRITGGIPLCELFVLQQQRLVRNIVRQDQCIAEMCLDRMRCTAGDVDLTYLGLEVELKGAGTEEQLNRIRIKLEKSFDLIPEKKSKFEIALAFSQVPPELRLHEEQADVPQSDITLTDGMNTAALKVFRHQFEKMKQNDAGSYRGDDIEFVHDMRVAVRRMRTAYKVFAPYIVDDQLHFLKDLKKTGKVLGVVRDLDVFRENYESYLKESDAGEGFTLSAAWNTAYITARNDLLKYLSSNRYLTFRNAFDTYLDQAFQARPVSPVVEIKLAETLDSQRQQCISYYESIAQLEPIPLSGYHQLRIYLKYFRYSLEYFRNILGEKGKRTIKETKIVQDHLGALQDGVVARKYVRSVMHWGSWHTPRQPYTLFPVIRSPQAGVTAYLSHIEASIDLLVETFPGVWQHFINFLAGDVLKTSENGKTSYNTSDKTKLDHN